MQFHVVSMITVVASVPRPTLTEKFANVAITLVELTWRQNENESDFSSFSPLLDFNIRSESLSILL